ncbi:hypothetical protein B0H15DRAFT_953212 [Mycena belliarum]|uniref:DUF6534 domain-containing protein n=1 Tax=Mycena belliarum TaxID=1033014 RepID=A0AAD6TVL4_9AGAR|nr:hypothetical protein B0H15DRAFT_953212 [Mycena belliae]
MGSPLDMTYGAMLIGVLFATFFQGVLSVQAYIYYESFPDDQRRTKFLVAAVWLLDVTHLVLICQSCYHYLITSWGDDAALLLSTRGLDLHLIFVGLPTLLCQAFFVHRIWRFSKHNWVLTSVLSAACLATCALAVLISAQIVDVPSVAAFSHQTTEVVVMFGLGGAGAFTLPEPIGAKLTCHLDDSGCGDCAGARVLSATGHNAFRANELRRRACGELYGRNWGSHELKPPSILAIAIIIAYLLSPHTFVFIAMHFSLGRLYTNALLATLNSRRALRNRPLTQPSAPSFSVMTTRVVTSVTDDEYPLRPSPRSFKALPPSNN